MTTDEIADVLRKHFPGVGDFTIRQTVAALTELRERRSPQGMEPNEGELGGKEVLLFSSYCGGDNADCSPAKPCPICLGMSNVFALPAGVTGTYRRQLAPEWNETEALSARKPGVPEGATVVRETGWLIELRGNSPSWWALNLSDGEGGWTTDSLRALRFGRKQDAEAYAEEVGWTETFASEHEWSDRIAAAPSQVEG